MRKAMMNALMLLFLVSLVAHIFGKMTVLRGPEKSHSRKLICFSDDDGSALVWNSNLDWKYPSHAFSDRKGNLRFHKASMSNNNDIYCKMKASENCLSKWDTRFWNVTNSLKTPIGPVFDQRWEEFKEYENFEDKYDYVNLENTTAVSLSFSVRAISDAYIFLCKRFNKDSCYWIVIGGWENSKSVIRKCRGGGVPTPGNYPRNSACATAQTTLYHTPLSAFEWRSFVIKWNSTSRSISLYDTHRVVMRYVDRESPAISNGDYHIFIRSPKAMLFRFHIYDFLHTTVKSANLTSPKFVLNNNKAICIQMLVGLCEVCDAEVVLRDSTNNETLERVKAEGGRTAHGLPMWQFVEIKKNLSTTDYINVTIQLIPRLRSYTSDPLWAIANVRQCPPNGYLRRGAMTAWQDNQNNEYFWPTVKCQKLFYKEDTSVNSIPFAKLDVKLDDTNCSEGFIGPQCSVPCKTDLNGGGFTCKGVAICYKTGCTCSPGFIGSECTQECYPGKYGHACKNKCGECVVRDLCKTDTGECHAGLCRMNNIEKLYVPPLCQIDIDKPRAPLITSTSKTTIRAVVPVTWKNEYEKAEIFYSFSIKKQGGERVQQKWNKLFRNMTQLLGYFENLQPATIYEIVCSLSIGASNENVINSDWQNIGTDCDTEVLEVIPQETSLKIDLQKNVDQLHPCPANWYHLKICNRKTDAQLVNGSIEKFPYQLSDLTPYTPYNVTIHLKYSNILFSREIHTLEGVPSKVINLRAIPSAKMLTLSWGSPEHPNGIVRYEVILKIETYYGCLNLNRTTPDNHVIARWTSDTSITIPELHPYTLYSAQVKTHNSRFSGEITKIIFETQKSEIPTAKFSQVKVQDWKLLWSPPEDCTTIFGPIIAKIKIRGISDVAKDFIETITTIDNFLDLAKIEKMYGAELYVATIYAVRNHSSPENSSAYQEIEFETPPKAPPMVTNLNVVEIDTRKKPMTIQLRWQNPLPPLNGKLDGYAIVFCSSDNIYNNCRYINVQLNEYCDLWDDYICKIIQTSEHFSNIHIVAFNVNVFDPSPWASITEIMFNNTVPDAPRNFTFTINDHSVVELRWLHPWMTGNPLHYFRIQIEEVSSNLRSLDSRLSKIETHQYQVTNYMRDYGIRLYLLPSTDYNVSIESVTITGERSSVKYVEFRMPSTVNFNGDLEVKMNDTSPTIFLNIPRVLNDTRDSVLRVIVKGPNPCEQFTELPATLSAQLDMKKYDIAWQAAEVSTSQFAGNVFTIGDNKTHGGGRNCPLKFGEMYEIVVVITERNESGESIVLTRRTSVYFGDVSTSHHEAWIVPVALLLVLAGIVFYFYRRKRRQAAIKRLMLKDEIVLSRNIRRYHMKAMISSSKQSLETHADWKSRTSGPEVPLIATENDYEGKEMTSLIKMKDFEDYVRRAINSGLLDEQYKTFPRGQIRSWDHGKLPQNKSKNRYEYLIAYDDTRVILKKLLNDDYSDYINANYITGYEKEKRYIATQGPKPNTVADFWRMIWQEEVLVICMLADSIDNKIKKYEKYWPDIGKTKKYGDIVVLNKKDDVFADYTFRTFYVTYGEETRKVKHLHYTTWPDHGVPLYTYSVVMYLKELLVTPSGNGPVVVHCNDGVGKTGTIVLCDICLRRAAAEEAVDVFAETASIRRERVNMVDNKEQYQLAHLALVECLLSIPTTLPCNDTLPIRIKELKEQLPLHQKRLQNSAWQDEAVRQVKSPLSRRNLAKNRFPELVSDKIDRIYLKRYPPSDEDSDYVSGVFVDGVKLRNQYLATQLPTPSTINDFWRMIAEFKVELILMLQPPDPNDPTCCAIASESGEFKPTPYLNITVKEVVKSKDYTTWKLLLVDNSENLAREQSVTILCCTEWKPGRNQSPPAVITMVTFWQAAERISRGDGPIVTLCHDGITGCGLYLALSFLLEIMAVESECNVCLAVRAIRRSRPDFVQSLDHLEYLYDAAAAYLEHFATYVNIS